MFASDPLLQISTFAANSKSHGYSTVINIRPEDFKWDISIRVVLNHFSKHIDILPAIFALMEAVGPIGLLGGLMKPIISYNRPMA